MRLSRLFIILSAFLISLGLYRVPIGPINPSFSHIAELLGLTAGFVFLMKSGKIMITKPTFLVLVIGSLFIFFSILNVFLWTKSSGTAFDIIGPELTGFIFLFLLPVFFRKIDNFKKIYKAYYFSAIFVYILNTYALLYWLKTGDILTGIPFWRIFSDTDDSTLYILRPMNFKGFPRFRFPFASTGGTGVFLAICGIFLFNEIFRNKNKRKVYVMLFSINTFFLIGTFSRTGWLICLLGIFISLFNLLKFKTIKLKRISQVFIGIFFVIVVVIISVPEIEDKFIIRFSFEATEKGNVGHISSRLIGINKFNEAPLTGIGIGNLMAQGYGLHTHSIYTSFLAERGMFIFLFYLVFMFLIFYFLKLKIKYFAKTIQIDSKILSISLFSTMFSVLIGHLFYQIDSEFIWLFYALSLSFINLKNKIKLIS